MKKVAIWLCLLLIGLCPLAGAAENLSGIACLGEERIAYSGSVDGRTRGVFLLGSDGSAQRIYDQDAMLLAQSENAVLVMDNLLGTAVLLDENGAMLAELAGYYAGALAEAGTFYTGNWAVSEDGAKKRTLFDAATEDMPYLLPLAVIEEYLYFLDARAYGPSVFGSGAMAAASLCRVPVSGGAVETISGPGTRIIGCSEGAIVYERRNFWYDSADASLEMQVSEGLYRFSTDAPETWLAALYSEQNGAPVSYAFVEQGVIYGIQAAEASGESAPPLLKRLTVQGEALEDIPLPPAELCSAEGTQLLLAQNAYAETASGTRQADAILLLDTADGSLRTLNEGREDVLFFAGSPPSLCLKNGHVFWISYNTRLAAMELYCQNLSTGLVQMLACGYSWAADEEAVG